jgi:methyl-accepting chemotaxis protein
MSSEHVGSISKAITDISAQTHVLALNAAIEAARSGAHGRGFSVIAEEVRKLAEETNLSSKRIAQIIAGLQERMSGLESAMRSAAAAATAQHAKVDETHAIFGMITLSMDRLSVQVNHIHEKIEAATNKTKTLVGAVHQVAAISEETAAGVEEVNSTSADQDASIRRIAEEAEEIRMLSQRLFTEISRFRIAEEDVEPAPTTVPTVSEKAPEHSHDVAAVWPDIGDKVAATHSSSGTGSDTAKTAASEPDAAAQKDLVKV